MTRLLLIQTGQTTWEAQRRIESPTGAPLTDAGIETVQKTADELGDEKVKTIYACSGEAEQQTAKLLAKHLKARLYTQDKLADLDYGLWQGLTIEQIKRRQPKIYKNWAEDPSSACPPGGETAHDAQQRLKRQVKAILKKQKNSPAALVLRPLPVGLLRCLFAGVGVDQLWRHVDRSFTWAGYEIDPEKV